MQEAPKPEVEGKTKRHKTNINDLRWLENLKKNYLNTNENIEEFASDKNPELLTSIISRTPTLNQLAFDCLVIICDTVNQKGSKTYLTSWHIQEYLSEVINSLAQADNPHAPNDCLLTENILKSVLFDDHEINKPKLITNTNAQDGEPNNFFATAIETIASAKDSIDLDLLPRIFNIVLSDKYAPYNFSNANIVAEYMVMLAKEGLLEQKIDVIQASSYLEDPTDDILRFNAANIVSRLAGQTETVHSIVACYKEKSSTELARLVLVLDKKGLLDQANYQWIKSHAETTEENQFISIHRIFCILYMHDGYMHHTLNHNTFSLIKNYTLPYTELESALRALVCNDEFFNDGYELIEAYGSEYSTFNYETFEYEAGTMPGDNDFKRVIQNQNPIDEARAIREEKSASAATPIDFLQPATFTFTKPKSPAASPTAQTAGSSGPPTEFKF